jgi:hypothetical protein
MNEIEMSKFEVFGIAGKTEFAYREKWPKFLALSVGPLAVFLYTIVRAILTHGLSSYVIGCMIGVALLPFLVLWAKKKQAYFTDLQRRNSGREILIGEGQILISSGELARGTANANFFHRLNFLTTVEKGNISYVGINLFECESFQMLGDEFLFVPKKKEFVKIAIKFGNYSADEVVLLKINEKLKKSLPSKAVY